MTETFDIFVVGGGINGCGIARDAAGRGYSICLAEMNDLASGTSSSSTKLIHGGLRYLEHYEFRLVREALMEREVLWNMAPHIIWPLRFVLPHHSGMRPAWLLRLGLFIYDHLGGRKMLPATRVLDLTKDEAGKPLISDLSKAFEYSDCWVNDSRLVVLNARDAADKGAVVKTRTKVTDARQTDGLWSITTEDQMSGQQETISARLIVNAAGPWVDEILGGPLQSDNANNVRLVQGSHIVVPKKFDHDRAYFFQNTDERIFFAIPYEQDFTLIGTTDQEYKGNPGNVKISEQEIKYLCEGASQYFNEPVIPKDVVWSYSGVRPLFDDGASKAQEATRDYVLRTDAKKGSAPVINIFGGKITTYRRLAESLLKKVEDVIGKKGPPWTKGAILPGGDFPAADFETLVGDAVAKYPFLSEQQIKRMARAYGTRIWQILDGAKEASDMGTVFGADLTEHEVEYLMTMEWGRTAEDVLWRRSKLGLKFTPEQFTTLENWMAS